MLERLTLAKQVSSLVQLGVQAQVFVLAWVAGLHRMRQEVPVGRGVQVEIAPTTVGAWPVDNKRFPSGWASEGKDIHRLLKFSWPVQVKVASGRAQAVGAGERAEIGNQVSQGLSGHENQCLPGVSVCGGT
ncbi:hypothetical protein ACFSC4_26175 [Deinococcus malanensis]|uniref:hypothetical protein n=1 Tax=Deinococcus malanensis TaxID=1706855 RepID=UPI00362F2A70